MADHSSQRGVRHAAAVLSRALLCLTLLGSVLLLGPAATAAPAVGDPDDPFPASSAFTELQIGTVTASLGLTNVGAFNAPASFDPVAEGYPAPGAIPADWPAETLGYAGSIPARDAEGRTVLTYCIDLLTETESGVTYERGEWNEANVPNLGYVAYILQNYYPSEPEPAGVADNVKSAAVQSAIWFFSDNLVLDPTSRPQLFALTSDIVADAIANGPAVEPAQPNLSISPDSAAAPSTGELVGPFTVTANGPSILRAADGVELFADAAGTQPVLEGATVQPGAQLWARSIDSTAAPGFSLQRTETVRESTVYLYDGQTEGFENAQKLILAQDSTIAAVASVRITRFAAGAIEVTKTISGTGAGLQGAVEVLVSCTPPGGGAVIERRLQIPAGTAAGTSSATFSGLPAESQCTITEPENGDNGRVAVVSSSIEPGNVIVSTGDTAPVAATNEYALAYGGIEVTKTITGAAAGLQGAIVVLVSCTPPDGGETIERTLEIPAGTAAGTQSVTVEDLLAGSECTVTEPEDGDNGQVSVTSSTIEPGTVTITEDETAAVQATNEYGRSVGGLRLTKVIGGPAAGEQGEVILDIDCDDAEGAFDQQFVIPAGSLAGGYATTVTGIPTGTTCDITETANGVTEEVVLSTPSTIEPAPVTILDDATAEVTATNTYRLREISDDDETDDDESGGSGGGYDDYLTGTGAPAGPSWALGLGLLAAGTAVLIARRRTLRDR
ncbi:thioester domain-containing protein [Aeromicrobium sp. MLTX1]